MFDVIVNLAERRQSASSLMPLEHPAGVILPFDAPADDALIAPEIQNEIRSGTYSADLVRRLPDAVSPGDRVLVIGGGLGVVSTLVARTEGADRVIVAEPNTALSLYIDRVHDLNGASNVETINAVLAVGRTGRISFCTQSDPRTSALAPHDQQQKPEMLVPFMDLNMILAEERINLIICDTPIAPTQLLAQAELGKVDRILLNYGDEDTGYGEGICQQLAAHGYHPEPSGTAILLRRSNALDSRLTQVAEPANLNSAIVLPVRHQRN